jgi:hypothetical protein
MYVWPVNTYCEPVIMSWNRVTMSWVSHTMYIEPLSISR